MWHTAARTGQDHGRRPSWAAAAVLLAVIAAVAWLAAGPDAWAAAGTDLNRYLRKVTPAELYPGADGFGDPQGTPPVVPILKAGVQVAIAFLNTEFVAAPGYSGKPIQIMIGLDPQARITGAKLVDHHEPIILVGIPARKIRAVVQGYVGTDIAAFVKAGGEDHKVDIVSGATVTVMVIDDSILRGSIRAARSRRLGGLEPNAKAPAGPVYEIDPTVKDIKDFRTLLGVGAVRRLHLGVADINAAFAQSGDAEAARRPEPGPADDTFLDLHAALVSIPAIGRSLLAPADYDRMRKKLKPGQSAILLFGGGRYSFKGSGYVRGGIFDRFQIIQGDESYRFHDHDHVRLGDIAAAGAPDFKDVDLFYLPADRPFDPTRGWRLELLVNRATGPTRKAFLTFELGYLPPAGYLRRVAAPATPAASEATAGDTGGKPDLVALLRGQGPAPLWLKLWRAKSGEVVVLVVALGLLTGIFFFQEVLVKRPRATRWVRYGFLTFTLFGLGFYGNAQLSVVNVMTFANALISGFRWDAFLVEPLIFILWFSVAASLLFWGRGAFCGWLCPFGALQELTNHLARWLKVPQIRVPWGLHQRLWPLKYMIFLVLFGLSIYSLSLAEQLAEIEPFKTAIILKFQRGWPFVAFAVALLGTGLFVERFYCRYLCPLGAALALPGRLRMFDWLRRYRECGNPCQRCANDCMVGAIHPEGHINPNECLYCLNCQTLYHDDRRCPVMIQRRLKRERREMFAAKGKPARPDPTTMESPGLADFLADAAATGSND